MRVEADGDHSAVVRHVLVPVARLDRQEGL